MKTHFDTEAACGFFAPYMVSAQFDEAALAIIERQLPGIAASTTGFSVCAHGGGSTGCPVVPPSVEVLWRNVQKLNFTNTSGYAGEPKLAWVPEVTLATTADAPQNDDDWQRLIDLAYEFHQANRVFINRGKARFYRDKSGHDRKLAILQQAIARVVCENPTEWRETERGVCHRQDGYWSAKICDYVLLQLDTEEQMYAFLKSGMEQGRRKFFYCHFSADARQHVVNCSDCSAEIPAANRMWKMVNTFVCHSCQEERSEEMNSGVYRDSKK